jgi:hypothetical protein
MAGRRRRRERRVRRVETDRASVHPTGERAGAKAEARRREEALRLRLAQLRRVRTIVGAAGFLPLLASFLAVSGVDVFRVLPVDAYLALWAGIFGVFIGLTIWMWWERRTFTRGASA